MRTHSRRPQSMQSRRSSMPLQVAWQIVMLYNLQAWAQCFCQARRVSPLPSPGCHLVHQRYLACVACDDLHQVLRGVLDAPNRAPRVANPVRQTACCSSGAHNAVCNVLQQHHTKKGALQLLMPRSVANTCPRHAEGCTVNRQGTGIAGTATRATCKELAPRIACGRGMSARAQRASFAAARTCGSACAGRMAGSPASGTWRRESPPRGRSGACRTPSAAARPCSCAPSRPRRSGRC